MDLRYDLDHEQFRGEVRTFLDEHAGIAPPPQSFSGWTPRDLQWQRLLLDRGYVGRTIPRRYGGLGEDRDVLKERIVSEEFAERGVSKGLPGQGITYLVPTLMQAGSEAQRETWIRPTLRGEVIWCQGYSEPEAGSDLASLRTRAVDDGDDFIINGQKIWTSTANHAQMMFCLVRTESDAPRHKGLSYLIFPMSLPGIEVRPLRTMNGSSWFNEVFLTDVRVPKSSIVGERGAGWAVANATLKHERGSLGDPERNAMRLTALMALLRDEQGHGLGELPPALVDRLMSLQARVIAMRAHDWRLATDELHSRPAGVAALVVKLASCELNHDLDALGIDLLGELGILYGAGEHLRREGRWQYDYMHDIGMVIGGGTAQIQRNIIAERGLGLPREAPATGRSA
ncbi:MAG: acyl-CoA dehydrogenase [Comamonadaceae bacterium]|nr:MAG: acyl-CoA dehydrogenase [Comamonadaceae bacterium]